MTIENTDIAWERFNAANGQLFAHFDSPAMLTRKLADDKAFLDFKKDGATINDTIRLFCGSAPENVTSCTIPQTLHGEWICKTVLGKEIVFGDNVNILAHGGITIGDRANIGAGTQIITVGHGFHPAQRALLRCAPVVIEEGAKIGKDVIIVNASPCGKPLVIGKNAVVLPGSVVIDDIADNDTVAGKPAKKITPLAEGGALSPHWNAVADAGNSGCQAFESFSSARAVFESLRIIAPVYMQAPENISFGTDCFINRNAVIRADGKASFGDKVLMAPACQITVAEGGNLRIDNNVWIGAGARIDVKPGETLHIGHGSIIAAGAHITANVPAMIIAVGCDKHARTINAGMIEDIPDRWKDAKYLFKTRQAALEWNIQQRNKLGM